MRRGLTLPAAVLATAALAAPASAASPDVVISEVYGGGGNAGASLRNDFVELQNRGTAPVDVTGWSVQYASVTGSTWQTTPLSGTIPPGASYLVQEAAGANTGAGSLPTPDATGTINMSGTAGKVALVTTATALTGVCGADCDTAAGVRDFVGYGSAANDFETAPAPGLSNTTSASRDPGPDTDDNAADFTAGSPDPQSSRSTPPPPPPPATEVRIHDVQGAAHRSPLDGDTVAVTGVVTAVRSNGFYVQEPRPDADPRTSEALFVFTRSAPAVVRGDAVRVEGVVSEFRAGTDNLTTTQITPRAAGITRTGTGTVAVTVIGAGGRVPPSTVIDDDSAGDAERTATFDPAQDGIDFFESLEGMLTEVRDAVAVGPTNGFGEIPVLADGGAAAGVRTPRGGIVVRPTDFNPERIILDDAIAPDPPALDVGDRFTQPVVGVIDYSFANFKLLPLSWPTAASGGLQREVTAAPRNNQLAVASFNVENLDPTDDPAKFAALADTLVTNLRAPDLVALEEIQDNDGPANTNTTDASATYARLIAAIKVAGGPTYEFRQIDPVDDRDGGEPGGNIRVGFLFRTDRGLSFVDRPGGTPTAATAEDATQPGAQLTLSPGRIDPADPAWANSRKPLAGEFRYRGRALFVIANHFASKGGDDPLFGRTQPPERSSEVQRHRQAAVVNAFVDDLLAADPRANVIVLGDINDFEFSRTTEILEGDGDLFSLVRTLPQPERYTYVFEGNSQVLDQILVSRALLSPKPEYDSVHVNAEFAGQVSDHDPQVALLRVTGAPAGD